jgi:thymidylate synthase
MSEGFPIITSKYVPLKLVATELLWFLRGETNIKYLIDHGCHIWDGDCYKRYFNAMNSDDYINIFVDPELRDEARKNKGNNGYTQKEFIEEIKIDPEFCKNWADLGPIYGKQWRSWKSCKPAMNYSPYLPINKDGKTECYIEIIDQIANLIRDLKTNPDSRRLMVNSWNLSQIDEMVLPPCHYSFQVYTRELTESERFKWYTEKTGSGMHHDHIVQEMDKAGVPKRAISLMWNQRSVDTPLGLPFNIASYGLLLEIIAKMVNMIPDELIANMGDCHVYLNQIEGVKEHIGRKYTQEERDEMLKEAMGEDPYNKAIKELMPFGGGMSEYYESYKIPKRTREPFELPKLVHMKTDDFYKTMSGNLSLLTHLDPLDFQLEGYKSHPAIKIPLSN